MSRNPIRIGVVGLGKIAKAEHLPAIARNPDFELVFIVDRHLIDDGNIPAFKTLAAALKSDIQFDAIALCTSPQPRFDLCGMLFDYPCAVLLEKPPLASPNEARAIRREANSRGIKLFAAWHSRFAPMMAQAREWVQTHELKSGSIEWRENASKWHPGQTWLWQPGGFGVFDPGINALSILTALYPRVWTVQDPHFRTPANAHTPVSADFVLRGDGAGIDVSLEFHHTDEEVWNMKFEATDGDTLELFDGGAAISVNRGKKLSGRTPHEYDSVYAHFADLIRAGKSDMDITPLEIAADAFLLARSTIVAPQAF